MATFERIGMSRPTYTRNFTTQAPPEITVPITGHPRGGTTMVAAVVHALGIYLGPDEDLKDFHFEDQRMHQTDLMQLYPCIRDRNSQHARWGWKDPSGIETIRNVIYALRNPRVLLVFRDPMAIAMGEMRVDETFDYPRRSLEQLMEVYQRREQHLIDFALRSQVPVMLVSYEKAMEQPRMFIEDIIGFLRLDVSQETREHALKRIGRGYLKIEGNNVSEA